MTDDSMTTIYEALNLQKRSLKVNIPNWDIDYIRKKLDSIDAANAELAAQRAKPDAQDEFSAFDRACGEELELLLDYMLDLHETGSEQWTTAYLIRHNLSESRRRISQEDAKPDAHFDDFMRLYGWHTAPVPSPTATGQAGQPVPDWTSAPDWAQWYAVDKDGAEKWWRNKPVLNDKYVWWLYDWNAPHAPHPNSLRVRRPPEEYGVDWRLTLTPRPAAEAGA